MKADDSDVKRCICRGGELFVRNRKKLLVGSMILFLVLLAGCGYTEEEKRDMKRYEKQGKKNAREYIEEKYGFKAEVEDVTCDKINTGPVPDLWPGPNGNVHVEMKYKDKKAKIAKDVSASAVLVLAI